MKTLKCFDKMASHVLCLATTLVLCFSAGDALLRRGLFPPTGPANVHITHRNHYDQDNSSALFLTPFIKSGQLAEGRRLAQVGVLPGGAPAQVKSYAGFLTVNSSYNSNLYFWFFEALVRSKTCRGQ